MTIRPEMSSMILDESHFKFHVECKAKIVNAVNKLRKGADFLKSLSQLKFSTDKRWTQNSTKDPNVAVLMGILADYQKFEHRPSRSKVLTPIIEYAIGLYASDLFYRERGEWFLEQILLRSDELVFHKCFTDPSNWYPMARNSTSEEFCGNLYVWENLPDAPDINEEYRLWYGVDPTDDKCVISYDITRMNDLIRLQNDAQNDFIKRQNEWAEKELAEI
jgi:hypothetical protein